MRVRARVRVGVGVGVRASRGPRARRARLAPTLTLTSLWPPLIAAALSSGGTLWLTGCFHEDGLCDTLDGFGGGWTKSQILRFWFT